MSLNKCLYLMIMNDISARKFGLSSRTILKEDGDSIIIIKQRKSRIIMKDSKYILEIANKILSYKPNYKIKLLISGPICSKSIKFLGENGIEIIS